MSARWTARPHGGGDGVQSHMLLFGLALEERRLRREARRAVAEPTDPAPSRPPISSPAPSATTPFHAEGAAFGSGAGLSPGRAPAAAVAIFVLALILVFGG
ncbi:MAG: hypothetical protein AAGM38_05185 [Pseudomonadota bacterium]